MTREVRPAPYRRLCSPPRLSCIGAHDMMYSTRLHPAGKNRGGHARRRDWQGGGLEMSKD